MPSSNPALKRFAGRIAGRYLRFVKRTSTITMDPQDPYPLLQREHPFILAMWHGQFLLLPTVAPADVPISNIVARHGDAELIAEALKTFDMGLVRGGGAAGRKRDRGGVHAFLQALKLLRNGESVAMTADIPPGPARVAGIGIVKLAAKSGRPIIPVATASSRFWALDTWSRMTVNLPFSRIGVARGMPIRVPADADAAALEGYRIQVEDALNETTRRAYELAGADLTKATPDSAQPMEAPVSKAGLKLNIYRALTRIGEPALPLVLGYRARRGKELRERLPERFGKASAERPPGSLIWVHAASVGETNAILPLLELLRKDRPDVRVLLTTGTVTSAALAAERVPATTIHQFAPLDARRTVTRFLTHWRPDVAILTESEIWPNTILACHAQGTPVVLVNARMSDRSFKRWRRNRSLARPIFNRIRTVLAQNERLARWFRQLGARDVRIAGNLKVDAPPLPVDPVALGDLQRMTAGRPVLLAASTHTGEDGIVIAAFQQLRRTVPSALLVIAPRHPERGEAISQLVHQRGLTVARRSMGETATQETDVYVADTVGEMGLLYTIARVAFIGGSLIEHGGQNPLEAIHFGTALLAGPSNYNFTDAYRALEQHRGIVKVRSAADIAEAAERLLRDDVEFARLRDNAAAARASMAGALAVTLDVLLNLLPAPGEDLKRAS